MALSIKALIVFTHDICRRVVRVGIKFLGKQLLQLPVGVVKVSGRELKGILFQNGQGSERRRDKITDTDVFVIVQCDTPVFRYAEGILADLFIGFGIHPLDEFAPRVIKKDVVYGTGVSVGNVVRQAGSLGAKQVHGSVYAKVQLFPGNHLAAAGEQGPGHQGLGGDHGLRVDGVHYPGADGSAKDILLFG